MTIAELDIIVEALRENDKILENYTKVRRDLVKNLNDDEFNYVYDKLFSDGESHRSIK